MLGMPASTPYDLRFRALGIPVSVHPWFWVVAVILGMRPHSDARDVAIWVACMFVSILVHEFGHGLMARAFGYSASIVLYGFGGLCYNEGERQTPGQRLAVLFAGPGAGFLFAAILFFTMGARYEQLSPVGMEVYWDLMVINIAWGILNLLPVIPLDGGQITAVFLTLLSRRNGLRWAHVVSLVTAGLIAVLMVYFQSFITALLFGALAIQSYQVLQSMRQQYYVEYGDDADWWKR